MFTFISSTDNKDSIMGFSGSQKNILIIDALLALRDFKANSFGMALLDVRIPQMNGFQLYNKLQEIDNK
jgi:FixJ family two-component response regulator